MTNTEIRIDSRRAIEGIVSGRSREATRQVCRPNEFQLIGSVTKRPS
ncbi:MAG: hypothetical protein ABI697_04225 [Devosia sp.]